MISAKSDTATTAAGTGVWISVLGNDTGVGLSVTGVNLTGTLGDAVLNPTATNGVWYTPGNAFAYLSAGETATDTFYYTVTDATGAKATAEVTVTVTGVNTPPVARADAATTAAQQGVTINLLANVTDANRDDVLTVSAINTAGTKGTVTLVAGTQGKVAYSPGNAFNYLSAGETATDTFTYTVSDGHGGTSTAVAAVTVTGVNVAPTANPDTASTDAQHSVWLSLTANDTDPNKDDVLKVASVNTTGTKGSVTLSSSTPSGITYNPGGAFNYLSVGETATDTFFYTVSDGHGGTSTARATVTITGVNLPPVATRDAVTTDAQHSITLNPIVKDTDPNADDVLSLVGINTAGTHGSASISAGSPNIVSYSPGTAFNYLSAGETATDTFSYTVSDGHGGTSTSTVSVTVAGVNGPPVAQPSLTTTDADHRIWVNLLGSVTDPNRDDVLSVTSVSTGGTAGTVTFNPAAASGAWYTPATSAQSLLTGQSTTDSFTYTVSDGHGGTTTTTATVQVVGTGSLAVPGNAFYVAPNGNDNWSGRLAQPNAAGTDGPLATPDAARKAMEADPTTQTTYIEGGTYNLASALILTQKDSGQTWSAYNGQAVTLNGGVGLSGWTNQGNGVWTITPPAGSMSGGGAIDTLFVNGVAQVDGRFPDAGPAGSNTGWLTATASLPTDNTSTQFQFAPGTIPQFANTSGLYALVFAQNGWSDVASPVSSINYTTGTITLANSSPYALGAGSRFYLYNAAGQVSVPGEYSYDPTTNVLTYDAPAGFDGTGATIGSSNRVVGIYGANDVNLSGLTIGDAQSGGSALQISSSQNITVQGDTIQGTGNGILVDGGSTNINLLGNNLLNLNGDGILVLPGTSGITANGNFIDNVGALTSGDGIWFTGSSNDVFSNNVIENIAKFGIGGGSVVGASDASYNDTITRNTVINANQQTADGGGIYLIGRQQNAMGDTISYNTVTNTSSAVNGALGNPDAGIGAGIYLDDFASGVSVYDNLLQGNGYGVLVHLGWNNAVDNNVVSGSMVSLAMLGSNTTGIVAQQAPTSDLFENNTAYLSAPGSIATLIADAVGGSQWMGNVYGGPGFGTTPFDIDLQHNTAAYNFAQWQSMGFDATSPVPTTGLTLGQALVRLST